VLEIINIDSGIKNGIKGMFIDGMVTLGFILGNQEIIGILDGVLFIRNSVGKNN
jgi:hypothetical protein